MKRIKVIVLICIVISALMIIKCNASMTQPEVNDNVDGNSGAYRTLEEMLKELKEQRRVIEQQKLEEIKAKNLEKEQQQILQGKAKNQHIDEKRKNEQSKETSDVENNKKEIPTLIVRLRGKHSPKFLCQYYFVIKTEKSEKVLERELITDYSKLLKRPSLKVRADEVINFEFSEKPEKLNIYIWSEKDEKLRVKRGSVRVPDVDGKIVVAVEGEYKNGYIKYAVVLDVRK